MTRSISINGIGCLRVLAEVAALGPALGKLKVRVIGLRISRVLFTRDLCRAPATHRRSSVPLTSPCPKPRGVGMSRHRAFQDESGQGMDSNWQRRASAGIGALASLLVKR